MLVGILVAGLSLSTHGQSNPPADKGSIDPSGRFIPKPSTPETAKPSPMTREEAEAALRKDLKIERLDSNRLRIGLATLDPKTRTVRFPATVNMIQGPVEYALVADSGKRHEAVFVTKTSARDIHLAMILLGAKPGPAKPAPDGSLTIPPGASVRTTVEWETNGPPVSHPLASMIALADADPNHPSGRTLPDKPWLYQGSGFDAGGFQALREGSIVSLIGDATALVNNPGTDRDNDDVHVPNAALLPKPGMPVTIVLTVPASAAPPESARDTTLPVDFLDQLAGIDGKSLHLTLPNGQQLIGSIEAVKREGSGVTGLTGTIQHPEPGTFSFTRATALTGEIRFPSLTTGWTIQPAEAPGRFQFVATPAADAFRPRNQVLPTQPGPAASSQASAREAAEEELRKSLKIEESAPGVLRIGMVELHKNSRTVRLPATVNLREGVIEYALVTEKGKAHESLLTTAASPKDLHLALLLLGVKPAHGVESPDKSVSLPATASAKITVEWKLDGTAQTRDLSELVTLAGSDKAAPPAALDSRMWLCNGSRFNQAGFAAALEGSIVSLIADDLALINNPGADRSNDDAHFPNTPMLPPAGTPVTILITPPPPASLPKPTRP